MPERKLPGNIIFNPWLLLRQLRYKTYNWASEASPTLGCSIEISRDIYMLSVCLLYVKLTA